ncbi:hypothetical protein VNO77_00173 [Canavalia gladiata]|uniref:Gnk2-homologous domain-containing protein n=1 Tax=Canavalia gladiata TaxID=3824 RepID=A0AAN9R3R4_CANGL
MIRNSVSPFALYTRQLCGNTYSAQTKSFHKKLLLTSTSSLAYVNSPGSNPQHNHTLPNSLSPINIHKQNLLRFFSFLFILTFNLNPRSMSNPNTNMCLFLLFFLALSSITPPSTAAVDTFIFGGCSQPKYTPGSAYESSVNSLLTSLVNSATFTNYNNFTVPGTASSDTVYGLYQCRGDLSNDQCSRCVTRAVTQLGTLCSSSCGGALQLEGCFVKYDNATFIGVEDKTEVVKKCGPSIGLTADVLTRREGVLANLQTLDGTFRTSGSGDFQGVAQCTGDLSPTECQDCLSDAIQRLRTECGSTTWGQIYLAKCYARYSEAGTQSHGSNDDSNHNDDEIEKTLAILIGLIAGVALIIVFLSFLSKVCEKHKGGK